MKKWMIDDYRVGVEYGGRWFIRDITRNRGVLNICAEVEEWLISLDRLISGYGTVQGWLTHLTVSIAIFSMGDYQRVLAVFGSGITPRFGLSVLG